MDKIKLKKTLYIGLGGTGVATLLKVKKCFIDSYGEIPPMIGFLAIDTDTAASSKQDLSKTGGIIKLRPDELIVCSVKNALATYKSNPATYDWVPSANVIKLSSIAGNGAGQVRSNGRFIAYFNYDKIKTSIQVAITAIHGLIPLTSRYTVDTNVDGVEYATNINVFASVAGGTGSGMLIDTLCLVNMAMTNLSLPYNLYPWIVLPEVFRAMGSGPAMANVLYNTYGALRSLDYLEHLSPNDPAVNFGYTTIQQPLFNYAFLFNNLNSAGISFTKLTDLTDVIAKSAFLPANKMGDEIQSPFDNIKVQQNGGTYDILDKKAWAASAGSAELIYDSQAMGRAYACKIIAALCESMNQVSDGTDHANKFVDDANVLIRENQGRDDVIDALLSLSPSYTLTIDGNTDTNEIASYIASTSSDDSVTDGIKENYDAKIKSVVVELDKKITELMDDTPSGSLASTIQFLESLQTIISLCTAELQEEKKELDQINAVPVDWDRELQNIRHTGLKAVFSGKISTESADLLSDKIFRHVQNLRDIQRHLWGIRFYDELKGTINKRYQSVLLLQTKLNEIHKKYVDHLLTLQQNASDSSKFQVFLHKDDILSVSGYVLSKGDKNAFHQYFKDNGGLAQWLGCDKNLIDSHLWNYVEKHAQVQESLKVNIDDVLAKLPSAKVLEYLHRLKVLASPLWSYDPQGYSHTALNLDKFVIVGVGNRDNSILASDSAYQNFFDMNGNKASFASTNQYDRVYVLIVEDLLPVYAVNNFSTYKKDFELKQAQNYQLAAYLDEKLNNRMNSENFSLIPTIETDNVLQYWVYGFVFGYVHYDQEAGKYWIRSKQKGEPSKKFRFDLSNQRDVAYEIFKTEGLYKEIEASINKDISEHGNEPLNAKIQEIKDNDSYFTEYAQLSPIEMAEYDSQKFKTVKNLVDQEIRLMSK